MKLVSLNVGLPHQVKFRGKLVTTAIFKMVAVQHRVKLKRLNFEGDRQADLKVRGGIDKAVYSYPIEHYGYWKEELKDMTLSWGMFGENFTTEGWWGGGGGLAVELIKMDEHNVTVNDIFRLYTIDKDDAQVMER